MFLNLFIAGAGGFLGAATRAAAVSLFGLPIIGILFVNFIGSFAAGLFLGSSSDAVSVHLRWFFVTGFLGAFTTFSAFSTETFLLLKVGSYGLAFANIFASVGLCLLGVFLGVIIIGRG